MRSLCLIASLFGTAVAQSWHRAVGASCTQGVDLVFLQDTTTTFTNDLPIVTGQVPVIFEQVEELFVGSKFAVAEFKDKPFLPLGYPGHDYCYRLVNGLSFNVEELTNAYSDLYASAGGDYPEAQYQALINVAYDHRIGWREFSDQPFVDITKTAARMVILITDAKPHMAGDMALYPDQVPQLPTNPGGVWQNNFDEFCATYDYPSFNQVKEAIDEQELAVLFLIKPHPNDPTVKAAWQWFNEALLGQPAWFVQDIEDDSTDFSRVLVDLMKDISTFACTTTTEPPTTTTEETTTTKPPTTTTTEDTTTTTTTTTTEPSTSTTETTLKAAEQTAAPVGTDAPLTRPPTTASATTTTSTTNLFLPHPSTTTTTARTTAFPDPVITTSGTTTITSTTSMVVPDLSASTTTPAWSTLLPLPTRTTSFHVEPPVTTSTTSTTTTTEKSTITDHGCPEATEDPCEPPCVPACGQRIANQIIINIPEGQEDMKIVLEKA